MKNSIYFALAASLVAFASCDNEDFTDWAAPSQIQNAQGNVDNVDVKVNPLPGIEMDLVKDMTTVPLFDMSVSGATLTSVKVALFGNEYESDAHGTFAVEDLKNAVISAFGRAPEPRKVPVVAIGEAKAGENTYSFKYPFDLEVTLSAPDIESAYYLIGNMCDWDGGKMLPLTHVGDGNVYDYPTFTTTFECDADCYWKLIGQKGVDAGDIWSDQIGVEIDGDESTAGFLTSNNPGAGKIAEAGKYKLTINMLEGTYTLEPVKYDEYIYYIGATDGWSNADQLLELTNADNGTYTGFIYCADPNGWGNQFKFQRVAGDWGTELNNSHFTTYEGAATDCGGNIGVSGGESVYFFEVSLGNMSIKATEITNMNLVGDFNGWNAADDAQQMTWNADERCYEITGAGVNANGWKFTSNNSWDINLGGQLNDLVANGDNISLEGTTIKLYPTRTNKNSIYFTVE